MVKRRAVAKKLPTRGNRGPICIKCPEARFLDPTKEICYKTGGLYCGVLKIIIGKYDPCRLPEAEDAVEPKGRTKKQDKSRGQS